MASFTEAQLKVRAARTALVSAEAELEKLRRKERVLANQHSFITRRSAHESAASITVELEAAQQAVDPAQKAVKEAGEKHDAAVTEVESKVPKARAVLSDAVAALQRVLRRETVLALAENAIERARRDLGKAIAETAPKVPAVRTALSDARASLEKVRHQGRLLADQLPTLAPRSKHEAASSIGWELKARHAVDLAQKAVDVAHQAVDTADAEAELKVAAARTALSDAAVALQSVRRKQRLLAVLAQRAVERSRAARPSRHRSRVQSRRRPQCTSGCKGVAREGALPREAARRSAAVARGPPSA